MLSRFSSLERHDHRAEDQGQEQERQQDHGGDQQRQAIDPVADVGEAGRLAADVGFAWLSSSAAEHGARSARSCPGSRRPAVRWSGTRPGSRRRPRRTSGPRRRRCPRRPRWPRGGADHGRILRDVDGDDQRAVDAGTEAVGDQIVGRRSVRVWGSAPSSGMPTWRAAPVRRAPGAGRRRRWRRPRRSWSRAHPQCCHPDPTVAPRGAWSRRRPRRLIRCPARPRNAGSSVIEATTMISTMTDGHPGGGHERHAGDGQAEHRDDHRAAGEDHGRPAAATARPADSWTVIPRARYSRCRTTMNRA